MTEELGLVPGSVRGLRAWCITESGELTGVTYKQVWEVDNNVAECRANQMYSMYPTVQQPPKPEGHGMLGCTHGFYGYYNGDNNYASEHRATGAIEGYGEGVIGSKGFRVTRARILALTFTPNVPEDRKFLVMERYAAVPFFDTIEEIKELFPPDSGMPGKMCPSCGLWCESAEAALFCEKSHPTPSGGRMKDFG